MSKITFRADDALVEQLETLEISKSEAMREALRAYLASNGPTRGRERERRTESTRPETLDELVRDRVDELLADRLHELESTLDRSTRVGDHTAADARARPHDREMYDTADREQPRGQQSNDNGPQTHCEQCGEHVDDDHVYCPNCGEKTSRRLFCECGDEIRSDWSFCPSCGRRTPAADVLSRDSHS
ncbi:double zinc ribbon domain-containing protein [Natronorubrum bangense]|uniref:DZANK-type domain-containing protein n=2 Tax=Natronorubrum bangense TaxID=61858 RepID=L9WPU5_9EURY|nr:zinc ribbon domain-containing protein [Natronorubrum bangense]ELY51236.1 hypothetical protein C494_02760 [Natronorubrum bangense JCM 10635]QCC54772.1 CopG family transcriptional regulator [Natronorubrum bangense]